MSSPDTTVASVSTATLAAFSDAWNRHDIDALMLYKWYWLTDEVI